jgi:hypothetical protein
MKEKYPKFIFDWIGGLVLFGGLIGASILTGVVNIFCLYVFHIDLQNSDAYLMIGNAAVFMTAIAFFDFFIVRPTTKMKLNFNFSPSNVGTYLLIFPMMLGMMFIAEFVTAQIPTTGRFWGDMYSWFSLLMGKLTQDKSIMVITAVIMAPIFEEIIFRGIIQKGLINNGMKPSKAIFIAAVIFGLVHANPWQFVGAVLLGCVLGLVYERTKSLLLPMLLHGFNNLCSSILIYTIKTESFAEAFKIPEWALLLIGLAIFSMFYYLFTRKYKVHYSEN